MFEDTADRYFPIDVSTEYPESHMAAEGIDLPKEEYFKSLIETAADALGEEAASSLEGIYSPPYDIIVLKDREDEDELQQVHEHEFIHRLVHYEKQRPTAYSRLNSIAAFFSSEMSPEPSDSSSFLEESFYEAEEWEIRKDEDVAEDYDEETAMTEAVVLPADAFEENHRAYYAAVAFQETQFVGEGDWYNGLEQGYIEIDLDLPVMHHSEVLTHYLVHMQEDNYTNLLDRSVVDEPEDVHQAMKRIDKDSGFDKSRLIRRFAPLESVDDIIRAADDRSSVREWEEDHLNGYILPETEEAVSE